MLAQIMLWQRSGGMGATRDRPILFTAAYSTGAR
jgi:hypothetical protein